MCFLNLLLRKLYIYQNAQCNNKKIVIYELKIVIGLRISLQMLQIPTQNMSKFTDVRSNMFSVLY